MNIFADFFLFASSVIISIVFILSLGNLIHNSIMNTIPLSINEEELDLEPNFEGLNGKYNWVNKVNNSSYEMTIVVSELLIKINIKKKIILRHYDFDIEPDIYLFETNYTVQNLTKFIDYMNNNYYSSNPDIDKILFKIKYYLYKKKISFHQIYEKIKQFILI
jgi:hypothetical protein